MWWWRKVRHADIPQELRDRFETYGENVLASALAVGANTPGQGVELVGLIQQKRREMTEWLMEKRDIAERREQRLETAEWAILVFVVIGVFADVLLILKVVR